MLFCQCCKFQSTVFRSQLTIEGDSRLPPKGVLPLIKKKCNMHEKLDEVTTAPPRLLSHRGRSFLRPQRVEQRKLSPRNFYADERKKCKSSLDALTLRHRRPGKDKKKTKEFKSVAILSKFRNPRA